MRHIAFKRFYAGLLLLLLLAAHVGQQVHIYNEDPLHYAGFSGDLVPDNGARSGVSALCAVDNYYFFPYLEGLPHLHEFYFELLALLLPEATRCRLAMPITGVSLRAPPVA